MKVGVVVPCYRQEGWLSRTLPALERALEGHDWRGVLVVAAPGNTALPALGPRWAVISPPVVRPSTPGASRMLGLAAIEAPWVLFVDADLEVDAAWVAAALETAGREPALGGLWGRVEEWFTGGGEERLANPDMFGVGDRDRSVEYVTTPVLYRRAALLEAGGYDPRLHSEEDFELGLRFARRGFELRSLGRLAGRHWSAPRPSFGELSRRWGAGLCFGAGQTLRLYTGRPGFARLLRRQVLYLGTLAMWIAGLIATVLALAGRPGALALWTAVALLALLVMAARKRSMRLAVFSILSWTLLGAGLVVGFTMAGGTPRAPLDAGGRAC